jgi:hypothetical protein
LVRRLFRDLLHTHDCYRIYFARRGSSDRTQALKEALRVAQERFTQKHSQPTINPPVDVIPAYSKEIVALQAADYFLWTVQRLYELGEDRFISLLLPSFRLVIDMDDTRFAKYGTYYEKKRPLTFAAMSGRK